VSQRRDIASARTFFTAALPVYDVPTEVVTGRAPASANVIKELVPDASHITGQYENNRVECDHGRLKARLRPMRGLKNHRTVSAVNRGHAFIQNAVPTTSSRSTLRNCLGWPPHSTSSDPPSRQHGPSSCLSLACDQTRQQSRTDCQDRLCEHRVCRCPMRWDDSDGQGPQQRAATVNYRQDLRVAPAEPSAGGPGGARR
jgi:hypothetical protein